MTGLQDKYKIIFDEFNDVSKKLTDKCLEVFHSKLVDSMGKYKMVITRQEIGAGDDVMTTATFLDYLYNKSILYGLKKVPVLKRLNAMMYPFQVYHGHCGCEWWIVIDWKQQPRIVTPS